MELVKLGQVFVRVYRFCPVNVIPPMLHILSLPNRLFVIFKQYSQCQKARMKHTNTVSGVCMYVCHLFLCTLQGPVSLVSMHTVGPCVTCFYACCRALCHLFLCMLYCPVSLVSMHAVGPCVTCFYACCRALCHLFLCILQKPCFRFFAKLPDSGNVCMAYSLVCRLWYCFVRRLHKIAKSDCQPCRVCLSVTTRLPLDGLL